MRAWTPNQWTAKEFPQCVFWFMLYQTQPRQFSGPIHTFSNVPLASHTQCYQNWAKSPHMRFFLTILIPSFASNHTDSNHLKSQIPPYCARIQSAPSPFLQPARGAYPPFIVFLAGYGGSLTQVWSRLEVPRD